MELMGRRIATFKLKESHNHLHNQFLFKMIFLIEGIETFLHIYSLFLPPSLPLSLSHTHTHRKLTEANFHRMKI